MFIEKIGGTEERLYRLVAPLIMDPVVLRQNNNYPFPTSEAYVWYVARNGTPGEVKGFVPVEIRGNQAIINNYYIANKDKDVLDAILQKIVKDAVEKKLLSVTQVEDVAVFKKNGFSTVRVWKLYVKMEIQKKQILP